jgi:gliding motility-associated protein GldC
MAVNCNILGESFVVSCIFLSLESNKMKSNEINFIVELDENKLPSSIKWLAEEIKPIEFKEAKALLISLWDREENVTLAMDLWTKDMLINEMSALFYQTIVHLADSFERATSDEGAAKLLRESAEKFADYVRLKETTQEPK